MPLGTTVIQEADKEVGVIEVPAHSNCTKFIKEFGYPVCAAWCAMFVSCMVRRIFGKWILHTASVWQARADAQAGKNGMKWHPKNSKIGVGWAALFDFGQRGNPGDFHISLIRAVGTWNVNPGSGSFQTDGGNEGDAVRQQWRDGKYILGFIEFPYSDIQELPTVPIQEDEEMAIIWQEPGGPGKDGLYEVLGPIMRWIQNSDDFWALVNSGGVKMEIKDGKSVASIVKAPANAFYKKALVGPKPYPDYPGEIAVRL